MVIGLYGGVGSGKSLALRYLAEKYGAQILETDKTAHELYEKGEAGFAAAVKVLGSSIVSADGTLDRKAMADLLYRDPQKLLLLDSCIHPLVWEKIREKIAAEKEKNGADALIIVESALPQKENDICDEIWYVYSSKETRIGRLRENRGYTEKRIREIMERQPSEEAYRKMASRVLLNDGTEEDLKAEIDRALEQSGGNGRNENRMPLEKTGKT
jgi:dephospho-CoA kinase